MTKSAIEALGKRLATHSPPASGDIKSLQELLLSFDEPLAIAVDLVRNRLGCEPNFRIKTTGVILDKLHRHGGSILKSMQDLAGMRIVSDCSRHQQDQIASQLMQLFTEFGRPLPKLVDRRTQPSHGYRAVHVIVYVNGAPIEIQVRTKLQHEWADLFEKLADRVGRGIRYGEPPEHFRDRMVGFRDIMVGPAAGDPTISPRKISSLEMAYTEFYGRFEAIVRIAHDLADLIDSHERYAPTATADALVVLEESITSMFAGMRSIIELMPRTRRENP